MAAWDGVLAGGAPWEGQEGREGGRCTEERFREKPLKKARGGPFLPLKPGESFEPQSISSAPRAKTTHLSRSTKLQGEACGTATARAWCGGARVPRDPGGQPEPPAPRSPPWPLGSFSRLACAPPRAPGGGEAQSAGTKRQMKVNECLKVEKPPVRGEGGRRPSTDGWRRSHHPWVPARRHPSREISKPRPLPPQSFSPQLSISF